MKSLWGRMRLPLCVLVLAACALADDSQDRRSKLPFIADAVGNTLPPPSNVPATVGSPVNLLTPDRYEFYTFDESGELVKRLMTLEEIQAIVAAGEETEGLVTFANDNQPTIAFNFSQPPYTKVHSVVTNVQNVLKAQMEAHKNRPQTQPPLDTPDVSDSWSLILPSIFGNTGVDIVPDKSSGSFITPETETIELDTSNFEDENSLGKEGAHLIPTNSTTESYDIIDNKPDYDKLPERTKSPSLSTKTATKPTTTVRTTTVTRKRVPTTTTTTFKPRQTMTTTSKPKTTKTTTSTTTPTTTSTTTTTITTTTITSTAKPKSTTTSTTARPRIPTPTTTVKPSSILTTTIKNKPLVTTNRPLRTTPTQYRRTTITTTSSSRPNNASISLVTTRRPTYTFKPSYADDSSEIPNTVSLSFGAVIDSKKPVKYEQVSSFVPVSTITYITEKSTRRPVVITTSKVPITSTKRIISSSTASNPKLQITTNKPYASTSSYLSTATSDHEYDKINSTTITTQSVSPSTTVSSTEFLTINNQQSDLKNAEDKENNSQTEKENDPVIPLFDVAQSISQIASDLGSNFPSLQTSNNLVENTKITNNMDVESKENLEIDIPTDNENDQKMQNNNNADNFVKISTLDPHEKNGNITVPDKEKEGSYLNNQKKEISSSTTTTSTTTTTSSTTIDPILSESMEDLLSQVVHSAPESIVTSDKNYDTSKQGNIQPVTENNIEEETTTKKIRMEESSTIAGQNIEATVTEESDKLISNDTNDIPMIQKGEIAQNSKESIFEQNIINKSEIKDETDKKNSSLDIPKSPNKILSSTQESSERPDEVSIENKNETTNTLPSSTLQDKPITSTEPLQKFESTTLKLGSTTRQQDGNIPINTLKEKTQLSSSSDKNRLHINQNEKETVGFPKIDEFKKKIQKVNIDDKELVNENNNSWKLISTVSPTKTNDIGKEKHKNDDFNPPEINDDKNIILDFSKENQGLEVTTKDLGEDIAQFTELCNELAFQYWNNLVKDLDKKRSFVLSPYSITSMLAMMFMGARGSTSGEMNEILKLDDMVTFNPHFTLKNISDSIETSSGSGVAISAFIRELYSDRSKGKILTFYKERAQHFYNGHVEEINFKLISDIIRRRTNLLVKRYTWGKIIEYMKTNTISMHPPLAAYSANIFQTDCSSSSVEGRDGEMYFVVSPNVRQRRLVPVPAVVYRSNFLAGYDPVLDATAAALGNTNSVISTLFLMPGQQGNVVHAEDLEALEKRLLDSNPTSSSWNRLLRTLLPRVGLELQIPRFSHKSIFNISSTLRSMGLKDLFDQEHADLAGLNGPSKDLYLSDMIQTTTFVTCGEGVIAEQHHIEEYPETLDLIQKRRTARWVTGWDEPRDYQRAFHDPHDVGEAMHLPLHLRPRQARLPSRNAQPARLKFDRPFLFFVRHNPSGMILYVGRYNPRLLP